MTQPPPPNKNQRPARDAILYRLRHDLITLMRRELTRAQPDPLRLLGAWLLLIGGQRRSTAPTAPASVIDDLDMDDDSDAETDDSDETADMDDDAHDSAELAALFDTAPFQRGNPYPDRLLFRDYATTQPWETRDAYGFGPWLIHAEAPTYVEEVLWMTRLALATQSKAQSKADQLTNPHLLLRRLCRLSRAPGHWADTDIQRRRYGQARGLDVTWFRPVALALRKHIERYDHLIATISRNRREAFGPYWLTAGDCADIVGEELSLGDIFGIVPLPLRADFDEDSDFQKLFWNVLEAVNTRYRLLRTCGLPPQDWLDETPARKRQTPNQAPQDDKGLSINRLKGLAAIRREFNRLRREANPAAPHWASAGHPALCERLFREAFEQVRQQPACQGKPGGFASVEAWLDSKEGQAMLSRGLYWRVSLTDEDEDYFHAIPDARPTPTEWWADALNMDKIRQEAGPRLAQDPVLEMFVDGALVRDWDITEPDGLYANPLFQAKIATDPRYAKLDPTQLGHQLRQRLQLLIVDVLLDTEPQPPATVVLDYLRWVVIQSQPALGKGGLFKNKSFQAKLAEEPRLAGLKPRELNERLHHEAMHWLDCLVNRI